MKVKYKKSFIVIYSLTCLFCVQSSINDGADFKAVADAMKVIGFTGDEIQTVYKILATILHLVVTDKTKSLFTSGASCVPDVSACRVD